MFLELCLWFALVVCIGVLQILLFLMLALWRKLYDDYPLVGACIIILHLMGWFLLDAFFVELLWTGGGCMK